MNQQRPVPPSLRHRLDRLKYTPATTILHELTNLGGGPLTLVVLGSPEDITYEWVLTRGAEMEVAAHSDDGYGSHTTALRDGLIAALGAPDNLADLVARGASA